MKDHPTIDLSQSSISRLKRSLDAKFWMWLSILLALFALWSFVAVPSWLRGEWDPSNRVMRFLYQCQGTREQEAARWEPRRLLVSACRKPILIAESDNHNRVLIRNRADNEYIVLDRVSGEVVYSISAQEYFVYSLIGDRYLYATNTVPQDGPPKFDYIVDIDTGTFVPMILVPWEIEDVAPLIQEYKNSQGNVVRVNNGVPQALLFIRGSGEFTAYKLTTMVPPIVNDLITSWNPPGLMSYDYMILDADVAGGGEDCVIGEHKMAEGVNPMGQPGSTFCLIRFALPVVTKP